VVVNRFRLGRAPTALESIEEEGALIVVSDPDSPLVERLGWAEELAALGPEGFLIRRDRRSAWRDKCVAYFDGRRSAAP
jgi:hypothetical protein